MKLLGRVHAPRLLIAAAALVVFVLLAVKLNGIEKTELVNRTGQSFETGVVTAVISDNAQEDGTRVGEQTVLVRMTSGREKGRELRATSSAGYLFGAACRAGMRVVVMQSVAGDAVTAAVYSRDRGRVMLAFALIYLLVLCAVGGRQGVRGAAGLVFTFAVIICIYLPLVYLGWPPCWTAVLICALTAAVTLYLIGGATAKTLAASLGTLSGLLAAGLAAGAFSAASGISGWNVPDIENLLTLWNTNGVRVEELLFAGLLISSLGAVMDVAMSIASAMEEICARNSGISFRELCGTGMRIGRDMLGTDSNTLMLAFSGGSLSSLLLDYAYDLPLLQVVNSNNIGIAVMQGLSGSFGIILSLPATVLIAGWIYKKH